ncbi:nuclear transport factor 2 family protein [Arthrobacter sp. MMS18-M83]|uniref:nuclear transport factor 2 family protein n=1 Tax=Arthrobacter sp. MMS18-M83 TaxID=2996261 RepID=UPI00227BA9DB|nr:nuclear transport factor 2 family protein [Arthrobacter sp. MMS18-M83]WAH97312.1 nuclear transport factor 2 family protein [Arthrobacter sp. MMS18-M83]
MEHDTAATLAERLTVLELREAARATLSRYMDLCDVPREFFLWEDMASLFTEHAVWEGVGSEYTGKFGRLEGRPAILAMLADFLPPSSHFKRNVHLLGNGRVVAAGGTASGEWIMQQLSEYDGGGTELISARLTVDFELSDGMVRIRHFRTEKLFTAALVNPVHA